MQKINEVLENFPPDRRLLFCDEKLQASEVNLENLKKGKWAILVGPEGGFSEIERNYLKGLKFTLSISLGPRILRADTAAVTAISLWQNYLGDW